MTNNTDEPTLPVTPCSDRRAAATCDKAGPIIVGEMTILTLHTSYTASSPTALGVVADFLDELTIPVDLSKITPP